MISSISLVFWNFIVLGEDISFSAITSKNIFLDSVSLNRTIVAYKSPSYIGNFSFQSACPISTRYLGEKDTLSYFEIIFTDSKCKNTSIYLKNDAKVFLNTEVNVNLVSDVDLYKVLLDYDSSTLGKAMESYDATAGKLSMFKDYDVKSKLLESFVFSSNKRQYDEDVYKRDFLKSILERREYKYIVPVAGHELPTANSKVPNAPRPYRKDVTDGIHHSWDIEAPQGVNVIALDDGIILRIVDTWTWNTLSNIRKDTPNDVDKAHNLDIYRGNQVWLKTMKGEVVMYAHLDKIMDGLKEWQYVNRSIPLGTIWVTGVPKADYGDSHLDFSVWVNPYDSQKAGKYGIEDYMNWPWLLKNKPYEYVIEHQYDYFEKGI